MSVTKEKINNFLLEVSISHYGIVGIERRTELPPELLCQTAVDLAYTCQKTGKRISNIGVKSNGESHSRFWFSKPFCHHKRAAHDAEWTPIPYNGCTLLPRN